MGSLTLCFASLTASVLATAPQLATSAGRTGVEVDASPQRGAGLRNPTADEESIMELERKWARAEEKYDPKVLDEILAADFVSMDECGTIRNRSQEIASDGEWNPPGREVIDDMSVHIYGDTAIVLGRFTWTERKTGTVKMQGRFVDTFLRRDGSWRVIANSYVRTDAERSSACNTPSSLAP
jgi:ketosteroid isomerase-like protein